MCIRGTKNEEKMQNVFCDELDATYISLVAVKPLKHCLRLLVL